MAQVSIPLRTRVPARRVGGGLGLFDDLDGVLGQFWRGFGVPESRTSKPRPFAPLVDISETDTEYRIAAELPGLEEKDIDVALNDGVLTIQGERKEEKEETDDAKGYRRVETFRGSFYRAFQLPAEVDADAVKAVYKAGMLTVTLPKVAESRPEPRAIPVNSA